MAGLAQRCLPGAHHAPWSGGMDLGPWLVTRDVTIVSTVPTLAALWPAEALEAVRLLIFGGEACPPDLAERLASGEDGAVREVWNTYGPTKPPSSHAVQSFRFRTGQHRLAAGGLGSGGRRRRRHAGRTGPNRGAGDRRGRIGPLPRPERTPKYAPLPSLGWERAYRSGDLVRLEPDGLYFQGPCRRSGEGRRAPNRTRRSGLRTRAHPRSQRRCGGRAQDR